MALLPVAQLVLTNRAQRRRLIGFELRPLFQHLAEHFVPASQQLLFHVTKVFIGAAGRVVHLPSQAAQQPSRFGWQQRLQREVGVR
jgi:hypothetical protein